ncbi:MAG: lysophospholipid acyltransferase family protein, partial [Limisphaerales bacterium]
RRMAAMVSASRDGGLLARVLEHFGIEPVRGSSSRRGGQALIELTSCAERGLDLAMTPDGPRGPRYEVQDGVIATAQLTGLPIVPASYHLNWKVRLRSWDGFQIPLPFARCDVILAKPIAVPRELSEDQREMLRKQLEQTLREITRD